jgi:Pectinacetylesterase
MRLFFQAFVLLCLFGCPKSVCDSRTCQGCCSATGECLPAGRAEACGSNGTQCQACEAGQLCSVFGCAASSAGGGMAGGAPQGGGGGSAGGMPFDAGFAGGIPIDPTTAPLVVTSEVWTFVDFPNSQCGNGQPTGIGVNVTKRSKDLMLFFQAGEPCTDFASCSAQKVRLSYTASTFASENVASSGLVIRSMPNHPFKDMSVVYVPHCTADWHAGDSFKTYSLGAQSLSVHHRGAQNLESYLKRLTATFPEAARVFLVGFDAGAFGAQLNYEKVAAAFPNAQVHVLADSGQLINPEMPRWSDWASAWNVKIPSACPMCSMDLGAWPEFLLSKHLSSRFALLATQEDLSLRTLFSLSAADFKTKTDALATRYDASANGRYFLLAGASHILLGQLFTLKSPGPAGVPLVTFVNQWVSGDAAWASVKP